MEPQLEITTRWQHTLIPGRIKMSTRRIYRTGGELAQPLLIEEIVLEETDQPFRKRK